MPFPSRIRPAPPQVVLRLLRCTAEEFLADLTLPGLLCPAAGTTTAGVAGVEIVRV